MITNGLGISKNPLNDISRVYLESVAKTPEVNGINEGIRDKDPEKGTKERKARLEKKRGMKVDDHPEYKKGVEAPKEKLKTDRDGYRVPQKDADAARERLLAKARAKRAKKAKMSEEVEQLDEMPYQVYGSSDGKKKEKKIGKPVKSKKYADARAAELEDTHKKTGGKSGMKKARVQYTEGLDPVGQEDADIDNDGDTDKTDKYLHNRRKAIGKAIRKKKGIKEEEHRIGGGNLATLAKKASKRIDADVDGDVDTDDMKSSETGEFVPGPDGKKVKSTFRAEEKTAGSPEHKPGGYLSQYDAEGKPKAKAKLQKEGYHNWRQDLIEVMDDVEDQKEVKEKKVNNKIKINPELGEAVEEIGGTLIEMIEVDEMDVIIESVYEELIEEGYSEDDVEEAIEYSLIEAKVTYGHDTPTKKGEMMKKAKGRLRYLGRKAKEKFGSAKKKVGMASAKAQVAGYNKLRDIAQTAGDTKRRAKKAVTDVPKKAKKKGKSLLRRAAQKVVDRMSEETLTEKDTGSFFDGAKGGKYDKPVKQLKSPGEDPKHRFYSSSPTMNPDKKPAKPTPQRQTGDKAKDMATWAKANPTLVKTKTPNPLMKNFYTGKPDMAAVRAKAKADTLSRSRLGEEASDARKDRRLERRGHSNTASDKGIKKGPMTDAEKKKSRKAQQSAMDFVKAELRAKYGKGAVMNTKKKK